jgi:hypothetical protein
MEEVGETVLSLGQSWELSQELGLVNSILQMKKKSPDGQKMISQGQTC